MKTQDKMIPLLIEKPDQHPDFGCHVLFLDGHYERIMTGDRWPVTDEALTILKKLDAVGTNSTTMRSASPWR